MPSLFDGFEVEDELRPVPQLFGFDLEHALASVVTLEAHIPKDAWSARSLNTHRVGNAVVIGPDGLMLTIGYLVTEAEEVLVASNDGRESEAHILGVDQASGFALIQALDPLDLPVLAIGDSRKVKPQAALVSAGGGGHEHALCSELIARQPFAGYWEYYLEEALFVSPSHPHWSGAALIGPTGDLIGLGSLQMQQQADDEGTAAPINMFVPAELLPPILADLSLGRPARPPRPWLGVISQEVSSHVVIVDVSPGGPAAKAELRRGDIVHRVGGQRVTDLAGFYKRLWALGPPGVVAPLRIQREGDVFDMEIRTADRLSLQRRRTLN